jgi:CRP-like cAMP-binding protein
MRDTVRALEPTISLSITTEHFLSLLAENVELAEGIMRWIIDTQGDLQERILQRGELSPAVQRKVAEGLRAVDRVLMLQASPLLGQATAAQLLRLAACARPLALKAGADPLAGFAETSMLIVLTGTVTITTASGQVETADSGDVIGMFQTLSGKPLTATLVAATDGTALRFTRADVFDVLADETGLMQAIFAGLLHVSDRQPREAVAV